MEEQSIWVECFGDFGAARFKALLAALVQAGRVVASDAESDDLRSGLLCFDAATDAVCERLSEWSAGGRTRVLAVGARRDALGNPDLWRLLRAGAADVVLWDQCEDAPAAIVARLERWSDVDRVLDSPLVRDSLVGSSLAWISVLRDVVEVARFTDLSVLITGESGTGKELIARLIHTLDRRPRRGELVVLDCSTVVPELSGSEFFGHERGAFTNALNARDGAFALADGGTLFVDEIGELPLNLQAELLRVVQERTYKRVGGNTWRQANFRLISATNRDLEQEVERNTFRRDLFHRIATWRCRLPPLRERREDVLPLARHFLARHFEDGNIPRFDAAVREFLMQRDYAGNIRELRQLIARIAGRHVGPGPITVGAIPPEERGASMAAAASDWRNDRVAQALRQAMAHGATLRDIREGVADLAIRIAVDDEDGNLQRAARHLGVTDRALQLRQASRRQDHATKLAAPRVDATGGASDPGLRDAAR